MFVLNNFDLFIDFGKIYENLRERRDKREFTSVK